MGGFRCGHSDWWIGLQCPRRMDWHGRLRSCGRGTEVEGTVKEGGAKGVEDEVGAKDIATADGASHLLPHFISYQNERNQRINGRTVHRSPNVLNFARTQPFLLLQQRFHTLADHLNNFSIIFNFTYRHRHRRVEWMMHAHHGKVLPTNPAPPPNSNNSNSNPPLATLKERRRYSSVITLFQKQPPLARLSMVPHPGLDFSNKLTAAF